MKLCVKMTFVVGTQKDFLRAYVLKHATKLEVEGTAQIAKPNRAVIIACGKKDNVDDFIDVIHKGSTKYSLDQIEMEPFVKIRDYRGIFRVIE